RSGRTQQRPIRKRPRTQTETTAEDTNQVEYLPSVNTTGLLERVRAAIYLSLDELWSIPTDTALIATFLDPRFKHFKWATNGERDKAKQLVKTLYDDGDFFHDLEGNYAQTNTEEEDEISRYVKLSRSEE